MTLWKIRIMIRRWNLTGEALLVLQAQLHGSSIKKKYTSVSLRALLRRLNSVTVRTVVAILIRGNDLWAITFIL